MITTCLRRLPHGAFAALLILALAPAAARAQSDFDSVLAKYELTMPKVKAWEQASIAAAGALKARPANAENADIEALSDADDSFDDMVAKMDAVPEMRRAAHQARLTTREFATIGLVLMQAMMADQILQMSPDAKAPENLNPENLKFVRAHKAELQHSLEVVQAASADAG